MNQHRQMQKAKLSDLQERHEQLRRKALNTCRMIMPLVDPELSELEEMDIVSAASAMDDLVMQQAEMLSLVSKINQLEEALYG